MLISRICSTDQMQRQIKQCLKEFYFCLFHCKPQRFSFTTFLPIANKVNSGTANKGTFQEQGNKEITEQNLETCGMTKEPVVANKTSQIPLLPGMLPLDPEEEPKSVYGHLQLLFAQLQYSIRRYMQENIFSSTSRAWWPFGDCVCYLCHCKSQAHCYWHLSPFFTMLSMNLSQVSLPQNLLMIEGSAHSTGDHFRLF